MEEILIMSTIIAPITFGIVEVLKRATRINDRYLPVVAIFAGALLGGLAMFLNADIELRIWAGLISGLASVGLYEAGSKTTEKGR